MTEQEFFAVAVTGRKGLDTMAEKMGSEIMAVAAKPIREMGQTWIKRAIVSIANNDKLADVIKSREGLFSVYKALGRAATMGLQIGGQFPHAHFTPFKDKVELIVSVEGFRHAATSGPGAVLLDFDVRRVYDGEQVKIDVGAAKVDHVIDVTKDRGKLIGVYGILTLLDGSKAVDYMTAAEALKIRDNHSFAYQKGYSTPWKTDEEAMIEKTAAKKFLRKYAAQAEGLAMLYGNEEEAPTSPDVSDRMTGHLEKKIKQAEAVTVTTQEPEAETTETATEEEEDIFK